MQQPGNLLSLALRNLKNTKHYQVKSFAELLLKKLSVDYVKRKMIMTENEVDMAVAIEIEAQQKAQKDDETEREREMAMVRDEDMVEVQSRMHTKLIAEKLWRTERLDIERLRLPACHHPGLREVIEMNEIEV